MNVLDVLHWEILLATMSEKEREFLLKRLRRPKDGN
jgi:hypothetical protein